MSFDLDLVEMSHRVLDGLRDGNREAILVATVYALVAFGTTWLSWKMAKTGTKFAYRGAKWLITPREYSELYRNLVNSAYGEDAKVSRNALRVKDLLLDGVQGPGSSMDIFIGGVDISDLLTRGERRSLRRIVRKIIAWRRKEAALIASNKVLEKKSPLGDPNKIIGSTVPVSSPTNSVGSDESPVTRGISMDLCGCASCREIRKQRNQEKLS